MKSILFFSLSLCLCFCSQKMQSNNSASFSEEIKTGAEQTNLYLPLLKDKRVAVLAN